MQKSINTPLKGSHKFAITSVSSRMMVLRLLTVALLPIVFLGSKRCHPKLRIEDETQELIIFCVGNNTDFWGCTRNPR